MKIGALSSPLPARKRFSSRILASVVGAAMVAAAGLLLIDHSGSRGDPGVRKERSPYFAPLAGAIERTSYDLLFLLRGSLQVPPGCIVYIDEASARSLQQTPDAWDRRLHARLLRTLKDAGARAVLFDVVFSEAWPEAGADEEFAAAMREHGRVFIGAALEVDEGIAMAGNDIRVTEEQTIPPHPPLRKAVAGWGLLTFRPVDSDYGVRRIYTGMDDVPSATWRAAVKLGAPLADTDAERAKVRWLNYYGRADAFPSISYDRALAADGPRAMFRDRIVVVGGRGTLGSLRMGKDEFRSPYGLLGGLFLKGSEVHLTVLMNLLRGEWLTRLESGAELGAAILAGLVLGGSLVWFRPHIAAVIAFLAMVSVVAVALWLFVQQRIWFSWGVIAFVQAPAAMVWAIGTRYFLEERRRRALRDAFSCYLSPHMADRIANADFDLALGGRMVEVTVMFTDLENFVGLTEELKEPEKVAKFLNDYFTLTTRHILEADGTILKYLGDSVNAVWGAPLPVPSQSDNAVRAALRLLEAGRMDVLGHPLRTRVGLDRGLALAGNLGSAQRFDYAATGDVVNFASRLEGLNKYFGTLLLISDSVAAALDGRFTLRCVGEFRVVGKKQARTIYEVLGENVPTPEWLAAFDRGREAFRRGHLEAAEREMENVIAARDSDGCARFYLEKISEARRGGLPGDWNGVIEISAK